MKFLIVGLGSMGKRRIRNLQALGRTDIWGYDSRNDRREEAREKYGIETVADGDGLSEFDAIIISTPPDRHDEWIKLAIEMQTPAFVEASVVLGKLPELNKKAKRADVMIAPSCTLSFHPAVTIIRELAQRGGYGRITNFSYHIGQYLPDWHPWEKVGDSYTGKRETSGAREMVAFDLTWLIDVAGEFPVDIAGFHGKTMDFGADIDDTYVMALKFPRFFANMTVDTTARYATRSLILNLERGQILWRWDAKAVRLYDSETKAWNEIEYGQGSAAAGYNENITEDMYVDEMRAFIGAVRGAHPFPNTLDDDIRILTLLHKVEGKEV